MTSIASRPATAPRPGSQAPAPSGGASALLDGFVVARRNMIKVRRVPELLFGTLISPIMFIVLFRYVFGGAIGGLPPGVSYAEFLIPGIFVQTVVFGATITGSGLAEDMQKGIIDRFRSLPMSRMAVLIGRTTSDLLTNVLVVIIMSVTGLLVGWRINSSFLEAVAGFALLLLFAYAISWVMALVGLLMRSPEAFQQISFLVIFPLTFVGNIFVPSDTLPNVVRIVAEWNPVSTLASSAREFFGNTGGLQPSGSFPVENPVLYTLLWVVILLAVFVPLSTRQFARTTSR
ncbi:MAG: Efflux ABC transporter, permease protein [uncultured Quadrisphaera sp.]|uniref:Transport permease protein n=1 Tax=uncultured Quadrisphaera sp. TaxID=904978 RepID=A0A6J4PAR3_9ACTN|nr:MAG: Efflux ABC transporter, permease protein [uncultured Quadrisphaera sp.]